MDFVAGTSLAPSNNKLRWSAVKKAEKKIKLETWDVGAGILIKAFAAES